MSTWMHQRIIGHLSVVLSVTAIACGPVDEHVDSLEDDTTLTPQDACNDACTASYYSCLGIEDKFICLDERTTCWQNCDNSTTSSTGASPYPFYAVGSGMGDSSSDVIRFEFNGSAIVNYVKLGEAGRVLWDIAIDPYSNTLYAVDNAGKLYRVDARYGSTTFIGNTGYSVNALDFCPGISGGLFGWTGSGRLLRINTTTAAVTIIGTGTFKASGDIACSIWGPLYGSAEIAGAPDRLVSLNPQTGASTSIGSLGFPAVYALETDQNDVLFAATANSSTLNFYVANKTTGVTTLRATYSTPAGIYGLTTFSLPY